jgi:hypothetical protein
MPIVLAMSLDPGLQLRRHDATRDPNISLRPLVQAAASAWALTWAAPARWLRRPAQDPLRREAQEGHARPSTTIPGAELDPERHISLFELVDLQD